ncbi:hypothetical protein GC722_05960 [Auraticoccus sp. F435]|uniref:NlpC/P60 domain-containing protein n=1 Tax=Auraticoccus cholistanensis TaxID=2656650 RepID=A0A6A9V0K7_9ACTN|nr:NlpC/P60 family protein [Auraticoccus cholistanensis]MVA75570.1 hypothetical protein [Auraticoccus cholistanensis]
MHPVLRSAAALVASLALGAGIAVTSSGTAEAVTCRTQLSSYPTVKKGSKGSAAKAAECLLRSSGYATTRNGSISAWDVKQIKAYEKKQGFTPDGVVGWRTWQRLLDGAGARSTSKADKAVAFAKAQLGDSYRYGGTGPSSWDCSGLTQGAWKAAGVSLPRTTQAQYSGGGKKVSKSQLKSGDVVFFYSGRSHAAIYVGGGYVIHASRPGKPVQKVKMSTMPFNGAVRPA